MSPNTVYLGKITSIQPNYKDKVYLGVAEKPFKDEDHEDYANDTEFSQEYWEIKRNNFIPKVTWRKVKWLVISVYRPPSQNSEYFLNELDKMIDYSSVSYGNHVIIGDFNLEPSTGLLKNFMNSNALYNLIKVDTCFKGKGTCIDLILTNRKYSFTKTSRLIDSRQILKMH